MDYTIDRKRIMVMSNKGKIGLLMVSIVLGAATYKGIKAAKVKVKRNYDINYGFDWDNVLNHSADPLDFAKQLRRELKWAWQRVKRGYDDQIFWNFDHYLDYIIIKDLQWMLANRSGSPDLEGWTEDDCHEKWTKVLKEMLHYFMQSTEEHCSEINEYEDSVDFESYFLPCKDKAYSTKHYKDKSPEAEDMRDKYHNRSKEIDEYRAANHKKAMEMLSKYYRYLWD